MNAMASPKLTALRPIRPDELQAHILSTYFTLRLGIVVASAVLPPVLYFGGRYLGGLPLQPSISDYYFAGGGLMRDWFVGTLTAVGVFLYLYKGFSNKENIALNLAGIFAVLTAMVPCVCGDPTRKASIHGASAVSFFLAMAFVCLFCASETLGLSHDAAFTRRFSRYYKIIGGLLIASPAAAFVLSLQPGLMDNLKFFIEASAILVFASYWAVKSRELSRTQAEKAVLEQRAMRIEGHGVVASADGLQLMQHKVIG
jgi:hypothetical protein